MAHGIQKAHLLGFSDGGNVALCFALQHPACVETLILNGANLNPAGVRRSQNRLEANSRFFAKIEDVPTQAVTMGIGTIFNARSVLLVANGKAKANAIKAMLEGDVDPSCPASILKLHNKVYVVVDEDAASLLTEWN